MPFPIAFHCWIPFLCGSIFKFILKNIFLHQIKAKGHDKGHQILKEGPPGAVWIFSEFEYRYLVELESKVWCTISHHLVLFQNWPNLLNKIMIFATLRPSFE